MEVLAWGLVVVLLGIVAWLVAREPENPFPAAVERLRAELEADGEVGPASSDDPSEIGRLRRAVHDIVEASRRPSVVDDPERRVLDGVLGYLRAAVLPPLEAARRGGRPEALQDAVDALDDLAFYGAEPRDAAVSRENLGNVVQEVTREYAMETKVPIKFVGPDRPVHLDLAAETFKDALFLLLSNAGRYGEGRTVEVALERGRRSVMVRVSDRGPGFSAEALEHAFEPFWTTDRDALGLGLTHARRLAERMGGRIEIGNREDGGAMAELRLPGEAAPGQGGS